VPHQGHGIDYAAPHDAAAPLSEAVR
jgi:hypothetical protein